MPGEVQESLAKGCGKEMQCDSVDDRMEPARDAGVDVDVVRATLAGFLR